MRNIKWKHLYFNHLIIETHIFLFLILTFVWVAEILFYRWKTCYWTSIHILKFIVVTKRCIVSIISMHVQIPFSRLKHVPWRSKKGYLGFQQIKAGLFFFEHIHQAFEYILVLVDSFLHVKCSQNCTLFALSHLFILNYIYLDLCKRSKKLELQVSRLYRFSPGCISALEVLLLDVYDVLHPRKVDYEHRRHLVHVFDSMAKETYGKLFINQILLSCRLCSFFLCSDV